ncbi:MAG: hypothetical protein A3F67_00615 [Verrucomicrobia bacterium RIFCSPHIGHO2_12_FULL_41_10]|nr:MAG: hypothetical protein A3F67_00615 [Verrucomicrobia bacterium RIFCSPHIGHO2_12_FULL_41_10]HLB34178.1 hypothetical protein [Chthoniobacterales bacterium]
MNINDLLNQAGGDWNKLISPAREQLIQSREALKKLRYARGDAPPSHQEKELESLVNQLTTICQQIEAQFTIVNSSLVETQRLQHEVLHENLLKKLEGWNHFLKLGLVEKIDFYRQWLQSIGVPGENRDPKVLHQLGAYPKNIAACSAWQSSLLFPRKISSLMEIGSKFGMNALLLSRMIRMGAIERNPSLITLGNNLQHSGFLTSGQPPIGFTQGNFQLQSASAVPYDFFDAIWFHRQPWNEWTSQDGPLLVAAIGELARRFHFLLLTTNQELPPRHELLTPLYDLQLAGEYTEGAETFRFFIAQRRSLSLAGTFFPCSDIRLHDHNWQGFENISYGAGFFSWNTTSIQLPTRRLLLGKGQLARTFLKRTAHHTVPKLHLQESERWTSLGGLIPELPTIAGRAEDDIGYHIILNLNTSSASLPSPPLNSKDQYLIIRSALRILHALRHQGLHLNYLRLGNFALTEDRALFLTAEFINHEELEDPLDSFLWLLRDLNRDKIYWHHWPIEPFCVEEITSFPDEYKTIATLALRSKNIDEFLKDPLVVENYFRK